MSDLREKIVKELTPLINNCEYCIDDGQVSNCPKCMLRCQIADRILALLPKMPELRWEKAPRFNHAVLGDLYVGSVEPPGTFRKGRRAVAFCKSLDGCFTSDIGEFDSVKEARAAVEAAVRKALGWEA